MKRLLGLAAVLIVGAALAQSALAPQGQKQARVGYLTPAPQVDREKLFRDELAKLGWVEGRNLTIEYRNANGSFERLPALCEELVHLRVDVIAAFVTQASLAAKEATRTVPIVMIGVADPLGAKLVPSLARPGGNVTGTSLASVDIIGKQLELLRELRPGITHVAVLWNPANPVFQALQLDEAKVAARNMGMTLAIVEAARPDAIEAAFRSMAAARAEALLILADPVFALHNERIAKLAIEQRLPAVGPFAPYADAGALVVYGADFDEMVRRSAVYVDRILKGAKPADLPVERPTRYELIFNLKTAKALGITVPPALVSRADRIVQ